MSLHLHQRSRSESPTLHARTDVMEFPHEAQRQLEAGRDEIIQEKHRQDERQTCFFPSFTNLPKIIQEKLQQLEARLCVLEESNHPTALGSHIHRTSATAADSMAGNMLPGDISKMVEAAVQAAVKDLIERNRFLETQGLLPGDVSKMVEAAAAVKDLIERNRFLETQGLGQEHGVVTGPHPTDGDLPRYQVVGQANVAISNSQPTDVALPSDEQVVEKRSTHEPSVKSMIVEAKQHCDHSIAESIWEAVILLNLHTTGISGSAFLVVGLVFNVVLQATFLLVVHHNFLDNTLMDVDRAWAWRGLQGHHAHNMVQSTQSSLVRAMCDSDPLLLSSANQQSLYDAILEYQATEDVGVPLGGLLCTMVLCTWVMYIGEELHCIISFANATLHLPRGRSTKLMMSGGEISFYSCSMSRVVFVMFVIVVRLAIAGTLLTFGCIWMARTVNLKDLVLNACALAMVLDMDELVFASVVTPTVKELVREIKPLKRSMGMRLGRYCSREAGLVMNEILVLLGGVIFIVVIIHAYVIPSIQQMEDIETALCGGFKDFVYEISQMEVLAVTGSSDHSSGSSREEAFVQQAVYDLVVGASSMDEAHRFNKTMYLAAWDDFETMQVSEFGAALEVFAYQVLGTNCEDYDFGAPDALPFVRETIKSLFGDTVDSCEDLVAHCPGDHRLLRLTCPEACGCAHPFSGLFKKGPNQGCPTSCLASATYTSQVASIPCIDHSLSNLTQMPGWEAFLTQWLETWLKAQPREAERLRQVGAAMLTYGCQAIGLLPARIQNMFCRPTLEFGSLNAYCPRSCDCINSALEDCPAQCSTMSTLQ